MRHEPFLEDKLALYLNRDLPDLLTLGLCWKSHLSPNLIERA